jgi:hypothetical protein
MEQNSRQKQLVMHRGGGMASKHSPAAAEATPKRKPVGRAASAAADGQITGLAGEFFVAAELLKRGVQVSLTFGNAKAIDLLAHNPKTDRNFTIQVKSLRRKNFFPISRAKINASHVYVFVVLNKPGEDVQYFVVPGQVLAGQPERFTKSFDDPKFPGFGSSVLEREGFLGGWELFQQIAAAPVARAP